MQQPQPEPNSELVTQLREFKLEMKMEMCELKLRDGEMRGQINDMKKEIGELRHLVDKLMKKGGRKNMRIAIGILILLISVIVGMFMSGRVNA